MANREQKGNREKKKPKKNKPKAAPAACALLPADHLSLHSWMAFARSLVGQLPGRLPCLPI